MSISVRVPGSTSNLSHGFDCMGAALDLANTVTVSPLENDRIEAAAGLDELAGAIRSRCAEAWSTSLPGCAVAITGSVPISRGLGSSSTVFLGLAAAFQRLVGRSTDRAELIRLGIAWEGHPDNVTAACLGGFTISGVVAGEPRWQRFAPPDHLHAVLAIPDREVRTAEARQVLPEQLSRAEAVTGWQRSALITGALATGHAGALAGLFGDGWHERHRSDLNPGFVEARRAAGRAGALGTIISGSGSTVLSFVLRAQADRVAKALGQAYQAQGIEAEIRSVGFDDAGLRVEES